ncbi:ATP-binding protein [Anaerolineales bacterium HSG6]|nr:ATP-binding protein [Anaerolineales bacterium HSG6]MDM8532009.1 ATP-binding protein [Anaerolineales bacterium HSG25]
MDDIELQKLQKESFISVLVSILALASAVFFVNFYSLDKILQLFLPIILVLSTCALSYRLYLIDLFRRATYTLVVGLILAVLSFMLVKPLSEFATIYGYLLVIIVSMAGVLINPQAVIGATVFAILTTMTTAFAIYGVSWDVLWILSPPLIMVMVMAFVSQISSAHLTETVKWALQSQAKAQHRSEDLFESQQQLKKANQIQETTNLRLQEAEAKTRELYQKEETQRRSIEILHRSSRALSRSLDLDEIFNLVLHHLGEIVPNDRTSLMIEKEGALEIVGALGFPQAMNPRNIRVKVSDGDVFDQIIQSQQPVSFEDVTTLSHWQQVDGLPIARSWLGVPLTRFDKVSGMVSIVREAVTPFNENEIALGSAFAAEAAISIENAQLYNKITKLSQTLEQKVEERTEELEEANTQLERLNVTKTDFIKISSHELRTPLTTMHGYSQMLLNDATIKANPFHKELVSSIYSGAVRLYEIINTMLDVAKIDERALKIYPEPLSITYIIKQIREKFSTPLEERQLSLDIIDINILPEIEADPDALQKVFYHLIINAIKYTPDEGKITVMGHYPPVSTNHTLETDAIEVIVADTGIGISPEYHELIFTKFYQTGEMALHSSGKTKFKGSGPGMGLAIVKGVVEVHQGLVWVESPKYDDELCPGSRFHILLPLKHNRNK